MSRRALPNRRAAETLDFACRGLNYVATVGAGGDGAPIELFLNAEKLTTAADHDARDIAILISFALQFGARADDLARAMTRDANGAPQGLAGHALDAIVHSGDGQL